MGYVIFALGFLAGAVVVGFIANRKPDLFAKVVKVANAVDNKVNQQAAAAQAQVAAAVKPPAK